MVGLPVASVFLPQMYNSFCKFNPGNHRAVDGYSSCRLFGCRILGSVIFASRFVFCCI